MNRNNPETNAKRSTALAMRNEKKTYAEIGAALGLSPQRCRILIIEANYIDAKGPSWVDGLPTFTASALTSGGYNNIEEVLAGFKNAPDKPTMPDLFWSFRGWKTNLSLFGAKRIRELGIWVHDQLASQNETK
jgi:hypothetical protein